MAMIPALIVDLDGTLALLNGRDPYDASTCDHDLINEPVAEMIACYQDCHPECFTVLLTGRPETYRHPTTCFLDDHTIRYEALLMRHPDDWSTGAFYKWHVYHRYIKEALDVRAVFEDEPVVCRMWHQLGLPVFCVGNPHAEPITPKGSYAPQSLC